MEKMRSKSRVQNASLHPPAHCPDDGDGGGGAEIPWVLLDQMAYVADRVNATTAASETWDGKQIQVTVCLARPPRVSCICVFCPGSPHTVFPLEPKILVVEEDLRIVVSGRRDFSDDADYYIYRAADAANGGGPSLKRLPRPPKHYRFDAQKVGILRCGTSRRHDVGFTLRPHRGSNSGDFYLIAALCRAPYEDDPAEFVLCLYNSNCPSSWSTHSISLDQQQRSHYGDDFFHINTKVISMGGDAGTMGFVDLWRGILICDVLRVEQGKPAPPLRYVSLPTPLMSKTGDARFARDIAVLQQEQGRIIKFVDLQLHQKPCPTFRGRYVNDGWMSKAWTWPVASGWSEDCWDPAHKCDSSDIPVVGNLHFEMLPKLLDHRGMPLRPFKGLDISDPALSLNGDDGTVYFMTKKHPWMARLG